MGSLLDREEACGINMGRFRMNQGGRYGPVIWVSMIMKSHRLGEFVLLLCANLKSKTGQIGLLLNISHCTLLVKMPSVEVLKQ